jgi:hypothetical protein
LDPGGFFLLALAELTGLVLDFWSLTSAAAPALTEVKIFAGRVLDFASLPSGFDRAVLAEVCVPFAGGIFWGSLASIPEIISGSGWVIELFGWCLSPVVSLSPAPFDWTASDEGASGMGKSSATADE